MARVFITGSSDGLGQMAAQLLIEQGHSVVLHARNEATRPWPPCLERRASSSAI
jgi:NAD(P)-dependent dehydrogenase (short-subunit alcohol dehydrogenase family)